MFCLLLMQFMGLFRLAERLTATTPPKQELTGCGKYSGCCVYADSHTGINFIISPAAAYF